MTERHANATGTWGEAARQTVAELVRLVQLHRDLADLEIRHDRSLVKRFLVVGGIAAVLVVCGLPLLLTAAAMGLAQVTELGTSGWLICFGTTLVLPAAVALVLSIRRLRAEFCGLRGTLAELHEDLVWLREWADHDEPGSGDQARPAE